jgi:hypothetical protein
MWISQVRVDEIAAQIKELKAGPGGRLLSVETELRKILEESSSVAERSLTHSKNAHHFKRVHDVVVMKISDLLFTVTPEQEILVPFQTWSSKTNFFPQGVETPSVKDKQIPRGDR